MFAIKRVYEAALPEDGYRVLVDRIWPRGVSKERAAIDRWMKEVTPSTELRTWFGHDPAKFAEFRERYLAELAANPGPLEELHSLGLTKDRVTLVHAAKDPTHNHVQVLVEALRNLSEVAPGSA